MTTRPQYSYSINMKATALSPRPCEGHECRGSASIKSLVPRHSKRSRRKHLQRERLAGSKASGAKDQADSQHTGVQQRLITECETLVLR